MKNLLLGLSAILSLASGPLLANPQGVTNTTVKLGSHTDLSGPLAIGGAPATLAAQIRFDAANAAGGVHGRKIELVVEDTQYQVPLAVRATNKLVQNDKVFALFHSVGTQQGLATIPITDRAKIPYIFPLTAAASMAEPLHPLHFSYFVTYANQASAAIRYFYQKEKFASLCMQTHSTEYGEENRHGMEKVAKELGISVKLVGTHKPTDTEFAGAATAIKNAGCDFVYLGTTIKDTIALYATLRKLGFQGTIASNMLPFLPIVPQAGGGAMEGLQVVTPMGAVDWSAGPKERKAFYDEYMKRKGEEPSVYALYGWLAADLTIKALENAGRNLTVESFTKGIEQIKGYKDPFGGPTISFSPTKHFGGDQLLLYAIKGGKWELIEQNLKF
ncbi:ABC transporter substrate-binding protein [Ferrovibrio sp.]|uniref:ABC transporter substrate-binding protein n=1 Tax=Ferrovibrio sp. TaxID=1917215 RepID=UPI003D1196C2